MKCYKITEKTGNVVGVKAVDEDNEIMIINISGRGDKDMQQIAEYRGVKIDD